MPQRIQKQRKIPNVKLGKMGSLQNQFQNERSDLIDGWKMIRRWFRNFLDIFIFFEKKLFRTGSKHFLRHQSWYQNISQTPPNIFENLFFQNFRHQVSSYVVYIESIKTVQKLYKKYRICRICRFYTLNIIE